MGKGKMEKLEKPEKLDEKTAEILRRKLLFQSRHYGTSELEYLLGAFAEARLETLDWSGLLSYEALLQNPVPQLYAWITGAEEAPEALRSPLLASLIAFCRSRGG
jgi:antitoxin CptB